MIRARRLLRAAVWASVGWNCRGLLDYLADRLGDTGPTQPTHVDDFEYTAADLHPRRYP